MESANLSHLRPHQQQFGVSSSLELPSFHGVDTNHLWNQNLIETTASISPHFDEGITSSRDLQQQDITVPPSLNTSIFHDLGYQWINGRSSHSNNTPYELQLMKIKEELSEPLIPKFSDSCNFGNLNLLSTNSNKHQQRYYIHDLNERQLLKDFSQIPDGDLYCNLRKNHSYANMCTSSRGSCSRIHPSSVISSQNTSSPLSCSLGMNILPLDNWSSTSCGGDYGERTPFSPSYLRGGLPFGLSNLTEVRQDQSSGSSQKISFINGVTETNKAAGVTEANPSPTPKKPRFESCSSIPPFKVRKEKLGDRIAALQQLVSPFGKTDTASVLMEAIGYIKFLQEQVETLSVPYMKSSPNRNSAAIHEGKRGGSGDQGREKESKRDLRSRGLCLVPLSCTSYFADDAGGVWSPPDFRGSI